MIKGFDPANNRGRHQEWWKKRRQFLLEFMSLLPRKLFDGLLTLFALPFDIVSWWGRLAGKMRKTRHIKCIARAQQEIDCDAVVFNPINSVLIDFSTLTSVGMLFDYRTKRSESHSLLENYWWELSCLEIVVESIVLRNEIYITNLVDFLSMPFSDSSQLKELFARNMIRSLPKLGERKVNIESNLFASLAANDRFSQYLLELAKFLFEDRKRYSLISEIDTVSYNAAIEGDVVSSEDILRLSLLDRDAYEHSIDKHQRAAEYALKTVYYYVVSEFYEIAYCPHPLRVPYGEAFHCSKYKGLDVAFETFRTVDEFVQRTYDFMGIERLDVPPVYSYVLSAAGSKADIIPVAIELRESRAAKQFREECSKLEQAVRNGYGGLDFIRYLARLKDMLSDLAKEVGVDTDTAQVGVSHIFTFLSSYRLPRFIYKSRYFGSDYHLNWLKDLARLSINTPGIQRIVEKLFFHE